MSGTEKWHYADETERRKWQNPEAVLEKAGLKPGMTLIDIGCGQGFFTLPASRLIGPSGKVFGLDKDEIVISGLRIKASAEGLKNIETITGAAEDNVVCSACADMVFLGIVLHDYNDPSKVLKNAHKMIKPGGKLVNLDWKKEAMDIGPPQAKRFDEDTALRLIKASGFGIESLSNSGQYHYLIVAYPI